MVGDWFMDNGESEVVAIRYGVEWKKAGPASASSTPRE